jgi:enterochelin esterase family protein
MEPASSRLRELATDLANGIPDAVEKFWEETSINGTPLIEAAADYPEQRLVTFLWRYADLRDVHLLSALAPAPIPLVRVAGTDVGHATVAARADLRLSYTFLVDVPASLLDGDDWSRWRPYRTTDPLNPRIFRWPTRDDPDGPLEESVVELDRAPAAHWLQSRVDVASGQLEEITVASKRAWLWHPPEPKPVTGLVVLLDGWSWATELDIDTMLANAVADDALPPMAVVMVEEGLARERWHEYGLNARFVDFLADELVPAVRARSSAPNDAERTIVAGQSMGGLTAAYAALRHPEVFGNVLSQSGSFWWPRGSPHEVDAEQLTRDYARTPRLPIRFYLEVGLQEGPFMLASNRHLRDVLTAREYDVDYIELNGGHCWLNWRCSLADGLVSLTRQWGHHRSGKDAPR